MEFNFKKWKSFIVISIKLLQSAEHATAPRGKSTARTREFIANIFRALCFSLWKFFFSSPWKLMVKTREAKLVIEKHRKKWWRHFKWRCETLTSCTARYFPSSLHFNEAKSTTMLLKISSIQKHINTHFQTREMKNETSVQWGGKNQFELWDLFDGLVMRQQEMDEISSRREKSHFTRGASPRR